jgi:predicted  nucleic acid-binding Zn-ribbon protein
MRRLPLSILLCALAGCAGGAPDVHTAGVSQSATQLCRPHEDDQLGRQGEPDAGICVVERQAAFPGAHVDDRSLRERGVALHHLRKKLHSSEERAKSIEDALAEATALLSAPDLAPTLRSTLTIEVRQLTQEKIDLERSIDQLEQDYAAAALEYDDHRRRIASQDRS